MQLYLITPTISVLSAGLTAAFFALLRALFFRSSADTPRRRTPRSVPLIPPVSKSPGLVVDLTLAQSLPLHRGGVISSAAQRPQPGQHHLRSGEVGGDYFRCFVADGRCQPCYGFWFPLMARCEHRSAGMRTPSLTPTHALALVPSPPNSFCVCVCLFFWQVLDYLDSSLFKQRRQKPRTGRTRGLLKQQQMKATAPRSARKRQRAANANPSSRCRFVLILASSLLLEQERGQPADSLHPNN